MAQHIAHKLGILVFVLALSAAILLIWASFVPPGAAAAPTLRGQRALAYGELPLVFEVNEGQSEPQVKFVAHGQGFTCFLTQGEAVLAMRASSRVTNPHDLRSASSPETESTIALRIQLVGASSEAVLRGEQPLSTKVNYLIGGGPESWHTGIPTNGRVRYQGVYPGTDLIYEGADGRLEYDFTLKPGAQPEKIVLNIQGANKVTTTAGGDLLLHTPAGIVRQLRPVAYQEIGGVRRNVAADYVLKNSSQIGFHLGVYDQQLPLVIDPTIEYSTLLGSSTVDTNTSIAVDAAGSAYVVGSTQSAGSRCLLLWLIGPQRHSLNLVFVLLFF